MPIRLHDTQSRELRELRPHHPDGIFRFYNCGPTVYAPAHIGNFRTFVINDVLRRLLELEYGPDRVKHVRNLTDVEDKTIRRSQNEGRPLAEITGEVIRQFHADCAELNLLPPHIEPTATGHIPAQIDLISLLLDKGHAYRTADGSVYFKVASHPDYGRLSRVHERRLQTGAAPRVFAIDDDEKEDGSDFALWKGYIPTDGAVGWDAPWGRGRPGWHIECSAMTRQHLGETIDLHTGAVDLTFPHHENEIAQSECCTGKLFSHHWYHNEHLLIDEHKMSKSSGGLYTVAEIRAKGFSGAVLRYALLLAHPRKQMSFSLDSLVMAEQALKSLRQYREALPQQGGNPAGLDPVFWALHRDLNFPAALGNLFSILGQNPPLVDRAALDRVLFAFGLAIENDPRAVVREIPEAARELANQRWQAKKARDFATADRLRVELAALGWTSLDHTDTYELRAISRAQ